jgi:hypothetical protein
MGKAESSDWTTEQMLELGTRHATLEAEGDLDGTMATLVENPVYEFWPAGKRMTGREAVRRYYAHLIDDFMPIQQSYQMVAETVSAEALAQEYAIELKGENGPDRYRVLGVLVRSEDHPELLQGERIWGSDAFLRRMIGPIWDELESIEA